MKKTILLLMLPLMSSMLLAQHKDEAQKMVDEGITYEDKGEHLEAIAQYDKALQLDSFNLMALAEKAYSLLSLQKYADAVQCCEEAIAKHPGENGLKTVYVSYGNALDGLKNRDKAVEVYSEGITQFPNYYHLYFNKGITLFGMEKVDEAIACFQQSVSLKPSHASSHNAIAVGMAIKNNRIPAILASCRFLTLEPQSKRAVASLTRLQQLMKADVKETGKNSVTISISPEMLSDSTSANGKENDFASTDLILKMDAALDYDKKYKNTSEVEKFIRKIETISASFSELQKKNHGFYWDYYVPYFIGMKEKHFVETFGYLAFASSADPSVSEWLKSHQSEIDQFNAWSKSFEWKAN